MPSADFLAGLSGYRPIAVAVLGIYNFTIEGMNNVESASAAGDYLDPASSIGRWRGALAGAWLAPVPGVGYRCPAWVLGRAPRRP